jgi:hypothetical protein
MKLGDKVLVLHSGSKNPFMYGTIDKISDGGKFVKVGHSWCSVNDVVSLEGNSIEAAAATKKDNDHETFMGCTIVALTVLFFVGLVAVVVATIKFEEIDARLSAMQQQLNQQPQPAEAGGK